MFVPSSKKGVTSIKDDSKCILFSRLYQATSDVPQGSTLRAYIVCVIYI